MAFLYPEEGADGKTERGTDKKREDARKDGKVVMSNEIVTIIVLIATFSVLAITFPWIKLYLMEFIQNWEQVSVTTAWNVELVQGLFKQGAVLCAIGFLPVGLTAIFASSLATVAQTKPYFQTEALKLNFNAMNPITGIKQLFSSESIVRMLLSMLKVCVITLVVWICVRKQIMELVFLNRLSVPEGIQWFMGIFLRIFKSVAGLFVIVAALDWIKEKRKYEKSIMMTKQEVKDEHKSRESSPQVKQKIKRKMREMSAARMMAAVPDATVVITNPTFIAIAIKYDPAISHAPIVVAKGKRLTAHRIREIAEQNGVPIVERKPLARAMYSKVEIGRPVPTNHYQAIAELLAFLYRMGNKHVRRQIAAGQR